MKGKVMIVMGAARSNGRTKEAVDALDPEGKAKFVDILTTNITPYDYEHRNKGDDFIPLMEEILTYDTIVLATPVYWSCMSTQMKMFLDRITDCMTIRKDIGRALEGKKVYLLVSYDNPIDRKAYMYPFVQLTKYLKMELKDAFFHYSGTEKELLEKNIEIVGFSKQI